MMTATNQAFIRAYRQDPPSPAPAAPAIAGQPVEAIELGRSVEFVSANAAYAEATFVTTLSAGPSAVVDVSPCQSPYEDAASDPIPVAVAATPKWHHAEPPTARRPLSSFQLDSPRPKSAPAGLDVGMTVPSFRWPKVCQAIGRQCAGPLDRLADVLESRAKEARALVGVTSLRAGDGATTALLCLAARLAARGKRAIVVDGNFAAPCLAQRLGVVPNACWQDVLEHGIPVGDAVVRAAGDQLDLLPLDAKSTNASQLASALQMSVTAGVLRYAYELALVDLGAILASRSQPAVLELVGNMRIDVALLVTRPEADPRAVEAAAHLLDGHGCELLGTIENRLSQT
jgi:Mrp family chromosome partitioning ATPase